MAMSEGTSCADPLDGGASNKIKHGAVRLGNLTERTD
jgi:hypothetical protein